MFFFFQAEDGIRDGHVTGVQTCALPISFRSGARNDGEQIRLHRSARRIETLRRAKQGQEALLRDVRSEERRVGKDGRARWSAEHLKKKRSLKRIIDSTLNASDIFHAHLE